MENDVLDCLKAQAWSRAKGELDAMMNAYFSHGDHKKMQSYADMRKRVQDFIIDVEENM